MGPLISVVIPVKNGEGWLQNLFDGLSAQALFSQCEIIVIDSGSTDKSVELSESNNATVYKIPPHEFNHGLTRNLGVEKSKGKYILMTVQDAVPAGSDFLEEMISCFRDEVVMAVCGLQTVPALSTTNPYQWYRPVSAPEIRCYHFPEVEMIDRLSPDVKRVACGWDNVCAMYRASHIKQNPFPKVVFGEDMAWCKDVLRKGYKVCYNPKARVFHYHLYNKGYVYRRTFTELYWYYRLFEYFPEKSEISGWIRNIASLFVKEHRVSFYKKFHWTCEEMQYRRLAARARRHFKRYLALGDTELDKSYMNICGEVPQAPRIQKSST
ncbi:MAG TPA: glycosyltransferase [Chitinophagaceae bacterium]|nr:glycosyltransferase [Chitinophagaceae bacterium]